MQPFLDAVFNSSLGTSSPRLSRPLSVNHLARGGAIEADGVAHAVVRPPRHRIIRLCRIEAYLGSSSLSQMLHGADRYKGGRRVDAMNFWP